MRGIFAGNVTNRYLLPLALEVAFILLDATERLQAARVWYSAAHACSQESKYQRKSARCVTGC